MKDLKLSKEEKALIKEALSDDIKTGLKYNFTLVNNDTGLSTVVRQMSITTIIQLLKKFEIGLKKNITDGIKTIGSHKNSRSTDKKVTRI